MALLQGWLIALIWFFPVYLTLLQIMFMRLADRPMESLVSRKERLIMFGWALLWFIWIPRNWSAIVSWWKAEFAKERELKAKKNGSR